MTRSFEFVSNVIFIFIFQFVERIIYLIICSTILINLCNSFLKIDTVFYATKYFITSAENTVKKFEFFFEQIINANIGSVCFVQKVHDHYVVLLTVSMASTDSLFDS